MMLDGVGAVVGLIGAMVGVVATVLIILIRLRSLRAKPLVDWHFSIDENDRTSLVVSVENHSGAVLLISQVSLEDESGTEISARRVTGSKKNGSPILTSEVTCSVPSGLKVDFVFSADIPKAALFDSKVTDWAEDDGLSNAEIISRLDKLPIEDKRTRFLTLKLGPKLHREKIVISKEIGFSFGDSRFVLEER